LKNHYPLEVAFQFLEGDVELQELEAWLYSNTAVEGQLGAESYLALISIDFRDKWAGHQARKILQQSACVGDYLRWRLLSLLSDVAAMTPGWMLSAAGIYEEYCRGYRFLEPIAIDFGLNAKFYLEGDTYSSSFPPGGFEATEISLKAGEIARHLEAGDIVLLVATTFLGDRRFEDRRIVL
jgi:hypothetical protein